jgi:hypothetical protein
MLQRSCAPHDRDGDVGHVRRLQLRDPFRQQCEQLVDGCVNRLKRRSG